MQRLPRGLRFGGVQPPAAGSELLFDRRPVGRATSVAQSTRFGAIGLGLCISAAPASGTRLEVAGGGCAEVLALSLHSPGTMPGRLTPASILPNPAAGQRQTANDEPQPQVPVAFGVVNLNPAPFMPKT